MASLSLLAGRTEPANEFAFWCVLHVQVGIVNCQNIFVVCENDSKDSLKA